MTEDVRNNNSSLIAYQKVAWLICFFYFGVVTLLLFLSQQFAHTLSYWGIVLILSVVVGQLLVMAADFRRSEKKRFVIFSYILLTVIVATAISSAFLL